MSESDQIKSQIIVVFCPNWVGDVVMATPTFECLDQNYPNARIIGLIRRYAKGVVEDGPWFDKILEINDKTPKGFLSLVRHIRCLQPEMAILLPNSFRAAFIARLGGVKEIYGYRRNGRSWLLSGGPKPLRQSLSVVPVPMVDYYLEICRWLDLKTERQNRPGLFCSDTLQREANRLLERYGVQPDDMVIGLNPGAKFGSSKCWPPEYFAQLAELLTQRWNCKVLLFIGPGEEELGETITAMSKTTIINTGPDKVNLALLKPLIKRCQLLVTNDTGPRHYAVAFDIPVVVIMGPTDPRYTQANLEKTVVLRQQLDCSPCHEKKCSLDHKCMAGIEPYKVLQASERLLKEVSSS